MKKRLLIILLAIISLMLVACSNNDGNDSSNNDNNKNINENINFADVTFKKYVLKQMGKRIDEDVTYGEAQNLKELKIDRTYRTAVTSQRFTVGTSAVGTTSVGYIAMDLADLQYFTGLEKLSIQNTADDDIIGWEYIGNCTKLQELDMNYYEAGSVFQVVLGEKIILGIVEKLPELKVLDSRYGIMFDGTMEKIKQMRVGIDINVATNSLVGNIPWVSDINLGNDYTPIGQKEYNYTPDVLFLNRIKTTEEYKEAINKADANAIKHIYITCSSGKQVEIKIDASDFTKFTNLESLCLTYSSFTSNGEIINLASLASLKYLRTLMLGGLDYSSLDVTKLTQLDTISLEKEGQYIDYSIMPNLQKVNLFGFEGEGLVRLPQTVTAVATDSAAVLNNTPKVKIVRELYNYRSQDHSYLRSLTELRYINFDQIDDEPVKDFFVNFENCKKLQYLNYSRYVDDNNLDKLLKLPELLSVSYMVPIANIKNLNSHANMDKLSYLGVANDIWFNSYSGEEEEKLKKQLGYNDIYDAMIKVPLYAKMYNNGVLSDDICRVYSNIAYWKGGNDSNSQYYYKKNNQLLIDLGNIKLNN